MRRYTWSCNPSDVQPVVSPLPRWALTPPFHPYRFKRNGGYFLLRYYALTDIFPLGRTVLCVARTFLPSLRPPKYSQSIRPREQRQSVPAVQRKGNHCTRIPLIFRYLLYSFSNRTLLSTSDTFTRIVLPSISMRATLSVLLTTTGKRTVSEGGIYL